MIVRKATSAMMLIVLTFLASCGEPVKRIEETRSGRPEVTIKAPLNTIINELIDKSIDEGYTLVNQSNYSLQFRRQVNRAEDIHTSLWVGNSYSENSKWLNYSLTKSGTSIRVVASSELQAAMIGGQINRQSLDENNLVFNTYQGFLNDLKAKLE